MSNVPEPPVTSIVAVPSQSAQWLWVPDPESVNGCGAVNVKLTVVSQPLASATVTDQVPDKVRWPCPYSARMVVMATMYS